MEETSETRGMDACNFVGLSLCQSTAETTWQHQTHCRRFITFKVYLDSTERRTASSAGVKIMWQRGARTVQEGTHWCVWWMSASDPDWNVDKTHFKEPVEFFRSRGTLLTSCLLQAQCAAAPLVTADSPIIAYSDGCERLRQTARCTVNNADVQHQQSQQVFHKQPCLSPFLLQEHSRVKLGIFS